MNETERRIDDEKKNLASKKSGLEADSKAVQEKIAGAREAQTAEGQLAKAKNQGSGYGLSRAI
jgi:hypothetical protein